VAVITILDMLVTEGAEAWQVMLTVAMGRAADEPDVLPSRTTCTIDSSFGASESVERIARDLICRALRLERALQLRRVIARSAPVVGATGAKCGAIANVYAVATIREARARRP
jgi:hypothetical protein